MVPRYLLATLVFALPLLVVAFAVVMGGYCLAQATGDGAAARALFWVAMACLMLTCIDLLLLVGVLGARALGTADRRDESGEP